MIISKTPYRVDLIGDGTDIGSFCNKQRGCIINATIKKYIYVMVHPSKDGKIKIICGDNKEIVENVNEIKDGRIRECLKKVGIKKGIEIHSIADAETGTGLGGSSSFTVGLLNAFYRYNGEEVSNEKIAKDACEIEIDILGEPIGRQDQYAAAIGGFNRMDFIEKGVGVSRFVNEKNLEKDIEKKMMMFYLGGGRSATSILSEQNKQMQSNQKVFDAMKDMRDLADEIAYEAKHNKIDNFGKILQKNWEIKKGLVAGINNPEIEKYYNLVIENGAEGAKLSGAGGTGFLLVCASPERQEKIREVLKNLEEHKFEFEEEGSKIICEELQLLLKSENDEEKNINCLIKKIGVAFDLEGTMVNLEPLHHSAHLETFRQAGLYIDLQEAIEKIEHFIGGPDKAIMEDVHKLGYNSIPVEEMLRLDKKLYEEQLNKLREIPVREGVLDKIKVLKENMIPYSIGSLTETKYAKIILEKSGLLRHFDKDKIILKEDVNELKPNPEVYQESARRMGISPENQFVFEDSHNGVRAALSAGSKVIAMPIYFDNPSAIQKLKDAGARKIYSSWNEINLNEIID